MTPAAALPPTGNGSGSDASPSVSADPDPDLRISVSSLAQRLGVASSTLRTWERRYGIGPSEHVTGSHRRYNVADVRRLECMHRAVESGASPAEAARYAINTTAMNSSDSVHLGEKIALVNSVKTDDATKLSSVLNSSASSLAGALLARDTVQIHRLLDSAIVGFGVCGAWSTIVAPVLHWIEDRSDAGPVVGSAALLFAQDISAAMAIAMVESPVPQRASRVLLGAPPGEPVDLELRVLGAAVARASIDVKLLPPSISASALVAGVGDARPDVLVLWLPAGETRVLPLLRAIRKRRTGLRILIAGRGSCADTLPRTVREVGGVETAFDAVCAEVS